MYTQLLNILHQEVQLHEALLKMLTDEHQALTCSSHGQLDELQSEKQMLIARMQQTGKNRKALLIQLAKACGVSAADLTIQKIISLAPPQEAESFSEVRKRLIDLTRQVRKANHSNRSLLRHCLLTVRGSMTILSQMLASGNVYRRSGIMNFSNAGGAVLSAQI